MTVPGLMIAAPASGSGKTTVTLGLLAALRARGVAVQPFKCGPDYIDPAFHTAATGRVSPNLDSWAMPPARIAGLIGGTGPADLLLAEGSMGLFDGVAAPGAEGTGASADVAAVAGWPVVLVIDASGQAQTAGAVALGLARFRPGLRVAGVILNRVASGRHATLARAGVEAAGLRVLGVLPRDGAVTVPERHLGLVQAAELPRLNALLDALGAFIAANCDLDALLATAAATPLAAAAHAPIPAPGGRIAVARDEAFSFLYPHVAGDWRAQGAELLPFSPLADEPPDPTATACWLPGGYPELHAGRLAAAARFMQGLRDFARTRPVHGECGGYMVLGAGLVAADGTRHAMAGLLGLETSFARRRMHLGYRLARAAGPMLVPAARGHEFHYASILAQPDAPLARVTDASGTEVPETGSFRIQQDGGVTTGSFFHLIDPVGDA